MWYRVFSTKVAEPAPAALLEYLHGQGYAVRGHFRGDEQGWFHAALAEDDGEPLELQRYLATEDGIRAELNTWAAWLETRDEGLMQRMALTAQLFTLACPDDPELGVAVCRFLARATGGVYQADGRGFFDADGTLLVAEEAV